MVQPLQPRSFQRSDELDPTLADPASHAPPAAVRDVSQIPDAPSFARPEAGSSRGPASADGPGAVGSGAGGAALVQRRLDAFRAAAMPVYHTREGDVHVAAPFRLAGGYPNHEAPVVARNAPALRAVGKAIGLAPGEVSLVMLGRGTPAQVQRLTQGLIDAGRLPPAAEGPSLAGRVRQMMFDHGIGLDCAGYVRQAFVAAHPNAGVAWRPALREDLAGLASRGMARVPMSDARPGDIIVLKAPAHEYGHTVVVYDARLPTDGERAEFLAAAAPVTALAPRVDALKPLAAGAELHVLVVDSSWGCGGRASAGGVEQRRWIEDRTTGQWVSLYSDDEYGSASSPRDHVVDGVYRPKGGR